MSEAKKTAQANIIAIIAFVILVIIAIWSGIQIVKFAPRIFSGQAITDTFKGDPKIKLSIDKANAKQSEEIMLNWTLDGKVDGGAVSFMYKCTDGVVFDIYDDLSKSYKTLPCNSPFNMPISSNSLKIKVRSADKPLSDVALAIVYTNAEGKKYKDIKKISVSNPNTNNDADATAELARESEDTEDTSSGKEGTISPQNNSGAQSQTETRRQTNNVQRARTATSNTNDRCVSKIYGKPDLSIHHLKVGTVVAGQFVQKSTFYKGETIVVKFTVSNFGTKTSPSWYFQALLPNRNGEIYTSKAQPAIAPCNGRFYTLKVVNPKAGASKILVNIDPHNVIKELNEINNSAKAQITVY